MAKRATRERPYRCQLCDCPLAESEIGFVCQHVAHGIMVTLVADAPTKKAPMPDAACTACDKAISAKKKGAEKDANIHIVCAACYREVRDQNIDYFTAADDKRGYVLVPRAHYDRVDKRKKPLRVGAMKVGRLVKLGFSPIPSTHPVSLERMWVRVTCLLDGGVVHGALANDPQLFEPKRLKAEDTVVFTADHVLDVDPDKPKKAAKKAAKKTAKKTAKTAKKRYGSAS